MTGSFVIQFHETDQGNHFDLMLEAGEALVTFRLPVRPDELAEGQEIVVPRLADHRRIYLTYEGEIGAGRGNVRIVDRGIYTAGRADEQLWEVRLEGARARGDFRIQQLAGRQYRLVCRAQP